MSSPEPILVVTGLSREAQLVSGPGIVTLCSGGSPEMLRRGLRMASSRFRAVVSFGVAGGLTPALMPGDIVVATEVVAADGRWRSDDAVVETWIRLLSRPGRSISAAILAGVDAPLLDPARKAMLHAERGADAVDMESHAAAAFAAGRGLPFVCLRAVCDPADRALPRLVADAMRPDGAIDLLRIMGRIAREPRQAAALPRLARDAASAFSSLRRCRAILGPDLGIDVVGGGRCGDA